MKFSFLLFLPMVAFLSAFTPLHAEDQGNPPVPPGKASDPVNPASGLRPWMGIGTTPVASVLRDHLELDDGFGIQIQQVVEDSPAAKAGLRENDILTKFDDQLLISPEHLSLLVQRLKEGDTVTLTLIRKGAEQKIDVTLGGIEEDRFASHERIGNPHLPPPYGRDWQEALQRQQDRWQDMIQRNFPESLEEPDVQKDQDAAPQAPPAVSVRPGFPVHVFGSEGIIKIDNQEGEVTITRKNDEHRIEIRDRDGNVVHDGEYDPETGIEGLPEAARKQLKVMKLDDLEVLTPRPGKTSETKPSRNTPKEEGVL